MPSEFARSLLTGVFSVSAELDKVFFPNCVSISIFLECVLKNFKTSESEITDCVKKFLKYAPDRKGGERKQKAKKD